MAEKGSGNPASQHSSTDALIQELVSTSHENRTQRIQLSKLGEDNTALLRENDVLRRNNNALREKVRILEAADSKRIPVLQTQPSMPSTTPATSNCNAVPNLKDLFPAFSKPAKSNLGGKAPNGAECSQQ
eukprot:GILI01022843.1.p1 GENE.GILI01022843.1~~GILI01022843.1.p1  ORF type:complete len:130 (-),score=15.21 GILI01022843.1:97-486(-)